MELKLIKKIEEKVIACKIAREIIEELKEIIKPGITTYDIEKISVEKMEKKGVISAFKGYSGYPANICVSVNEEVVHGIPRKDKYLKEGDIVSIDVGVIYNGFCGDCADTFGVGEINPIHRKLIEITRQAFYVGLRYVKDGATTGDIGAAIQKFVEKHGFSVVRAFAGHGIGENLHQYPEIPNFGTEGEGDILKEGMVICIEPMVNEGVYEIKILDDGWTAVTVDGKYSAHYENEVFVCKEKGEVLS